MMKVLKRACSLITLLCVLILGVSACGSKSLSDGTYEVNVTMEGGSGKASINSPATLVVKDGAMMLTVVWTSKNYDYMIVDDVKFMNENEGDYSTFTFPVEDLDKKLEVIGDTLAMSEPHEITYSLSFELVK